MTPWVLETLGEKGVKGTFFCVGENVERYPDLYTQVLAEGHAVGNHTHTHMSAWESRERTWFDDFDRAEQLIDSRLMRPPYGKIYPWHVHKLRKRGYEVIMWSFITYDFDPESKPEVALRKMQKLKGGHIVVMHDQPKAEKNLKVILPRLLDMFPAERFGVIGR